MITQGEYFTVRLEGSRRLASLLQYPAVRYRRSAMAIDGICSRGSERIYTGSCT